MGKLTGKEAVVAEIKEKLEEASSVAIVNYRGLTVEEDTILRRNLREAEVEYKVYKNTLLNFAIEGTDFEDVKDNLKGPSALVVSYEDPTSGPRIIANTIKESPELEFKGGIVEGEYYDEAGMTEIGSIAPREELLSRLLGSFESPIASFARVIDQVAESLDEEAEEE